MSFLFLTPWVLPMIDRLVPIVPPVHAVDVGAAWLTRKVWRTQHFALVLLLLKPLRLN